MPRDLSNVWDRKENTMTPSRRTLLILGGTHVAAGLALPFIAHRGLADLFFTYGLGVATTVSIYVWCRQESVERGAIPPGRSALWAALFSPFFVPVYFFRTRPVGPAFKLSAKAYGYYLGIGVLFIGAAVLARLGSST